MLASTSIFGMSSTGYLRQPQEALTPEPSGEFAPLESILDDIQRAISARLYYPALVVALTIPEICSALALDKAVFIKESHYVAFVEKYIDAPELGVDGLRCYRLRGGVIHRASAAGHPKFAATHVLFTVPESNFRMHGGGMLEVGEKTALPIDLQMFCSEMIRAARRWIEDHRQEQKVIANLPNLLSWRADGMPPFIVGAPLVGSGE